MSAAERDYVLGTHDEEIERLGLQHRVWRPHVEETWKRAGFGPGQRLIDVGCGPGYASVDLAGVVGAAGRVVAVDRSRRFLDALEHAAAARSLGAITTYERDLERDALPETGLDGAWTRWVYAFLRDPRALLARVVASVRPGGMIAIHEYIRYRSVGLLPHLPEMDEFFDAVVASWRAGGGEPDVACDLPAWLVDLGCEIVALRPIVEVAAPGDPMWTWVRTFVDVYLPRLVEHKELTAERVAAIRAAIRRHEQRPGVRLITPTVLEIVARRR